MKTYAFNVTFSLNGFSGDDVIEFEVSEQDAKRIDTAIQNGEEFSEVESLSKLYSRIVKAARQQAIDTVEDELPDDIDNYDIYISFSDV